MFDCFCAALFIFCVYLYACLNVCVFVCGCVGLFMCVVCVCVRLFVLMFVMVP